MPNYHVLSDPDTNLLRLLKEQNDNGIFDAEFEGSEPFHVLVAKAIFNLVNDTGGQSLTDIPQSAVVGLVAALASKQATLVSASNIKTVNGVNLLGSGNVTISGGAGPMTGNEILAALAPVDGAGSGLDADTLDGNTSAAFQPVDADLTAIAALSTTAFGRAFLALADSAAARLAVGLNNVDNTSNATERAATATLTNKTISSSNNTLTVSQASVTNLTSDLALKAPLANATFTGTTVLPSTTSIGSVTGTEISYLDNVTSSVQAQLNGKQAVLLSGTTIKTVNGQTLLGSGDLTISAGTGTTGTELTLSSFLSVAGTATVAGALTVNNTITGGPYVTINSPTVANHGISLTNSGLGRWLMLAAGDAESGSDSGTSFSLYSASDSGSLKDLIYIISRASGLINFKKNIVIDGNLSVGGNLSVTGTGGAVSSSLATIAALRSTSVSGLSTGYSLEVNGYLTSGDSAGVRKYIYSSSSLAADNGGSVIAPASGTGRWLLSFTGAFNARWAGIGITSADCTTALNLAITLHKVVYCPAGRYNLSGTLTMPQDGCKLYGDGIDKTILNWTTNVGGDLIFSGFPYGNGVFRRFITLSDFTIESDVNQTSGCAVHWRLVCDSTIRNVYLLGNLSANRLYNGFWFDSIDTCHLDTFEAISNNVGVAVNGTVGGPGSGLWISKGRVISGTTGVHCGGGFGGLYIDQCDIIGMARGIVIDKAISNQSNREIFVGSTTSIDSCTTVGVYVNEPFANGYLGLTGTWIASCAAGLWVTLASTNSIIEYTGGTVFNCTGDGIRNYSNSTSINVVGVAIRNNLGYGIVNYGGSSNISEAANTFISNANGNIAGGVNSVITETNLKTVNGVSLVGSGNVDIGGGGGLMTGPEILAALSTWDGAGSGLDADTLDGLSSNSFQPINANLTSLATGSNTGFGRAWINLADAAAARSNLSLGTAALSNTSAFDAAGTGASAAAAAQAACQPLDADLTAIAASATTTFGRSLLTQADAGTARATLGVGSGTGDVTLAGTQTLTNKTISGASNTLSNIPQSSVTGLTAAISSKQDALASGVTIKTINGSSILGSGNLVVTGSGGPGDVPFVTTSGAGINPDGTTDWTTALQALISGGGVIWFDTPGVYGIRNTLSVSTGTQIFGVPGAVLKGLSGVTGDLNEHMRYFNIQNANDCRISGLTFRFIAGSYSLYDTWSNAVIFVKNSKRIIIDHCEFDFNLGYTSNYATGFDAVWFGEGADFCRFEDNWVKTLGVRYSEYGASYNIIQRNYIYHSFGNGMSGTGNNSARIGRENKLLDNVIEGCGRMGIEDFSGESTPYLQGTEIRGNTIRDTGLTVGEPYGFGISADAYSGYIGYNKVFNFKIWGIEMMGNHGWTVENNEVYSSTNEQSGIIVNFVWTVPSSFKIISSIVRSNRIIGCSEGIKIKGANDVYVTLEDNIIYDWGSIGIYLDSNASRYVIKILNNQLIQRNPPTGDTRFGINNAAAGTPSNHDLIIQGNTVTYTASSNGGTGDDVAYRLWVDYMQIMNNSVFSAATGRSGFWGYGGTASNVSLVGNISRGVSNDLSGWTGGTFYNANNRFL